MKGRGFSRAVQTLKVAALAAEGKQNNTSAAKAGDRAFELYHAAKINQKTLADWASMFLMNDDFEIEDDETVVEWLNYVALGEAPTNPSPN